MESSNESTDSPPSYSSQSSHLPGWWRSPERLAAVAGAIALRWFDKLGQWETASILAIALGGQVTTGVIRMVKRLRGSGESGK